MSHEFLQKLAGKFIVFEGQDGSGKSTMFLRLAAAMKEIGLPYEPVREPGGTVAGEAIRKLLLDRENNDLSPLAETMLYMSSRAQLVERRIKPALDAGRCVISDRFVMSSLAYQGANGVPRADILAMAKIATQYAWPNVTLLLDLSWEQARPRMGGLADRMEAKSKEFYDNVRRNYLQESTSVASRNCFIIDASKSEDEVWAEILRGLKIYTMATASSPSPV
jgi:dTMP kinase